MKRDSIVVSVSWTVLLLLTAWMGVNILGYAARPDTVAFYRERVQDAPEGWGTLLRVHIAGGAICLLTGPVLFWKWAGRIPGVHLVCGMLYGVAALGIMIPTAFCLSFSAHGGWVGQTGFWLTACLTTVVTLLGFHHLTSGVPDAHVVWMIRSYALMTSALTFRLLYVLHFTLGMSYELNYPLTTWLSTLVNVFLAEWIVFCRFPETYRHRKHDEKNIRLAAAASPP